MNTTFKIGLITLLTIITTMIGVFYIWQIRPGGTYHLYGYFPHVGGLTGGSRVELMGVKIGEVISLKPEGSRVEVLLSVNSDIQLQKGSLFVIVTNGLVGDKVLEIRPPGKTTTQMMAPGDKVVGTPPASLDAIFTEAQGMLKSARALVEDRAMRDNITSTVASIARTSRQMEGLFKHVGSMTKDFVKITRQADELLSQLNGLTSQTRPAVSTILASTSNIARNMDRLTDRISQIANDPEIFDLTKHSIRNVNNLTERWSTLTEQINRLVGRDGTDIMDNIKDITKDIKDFTGDPEIKSNIKAVAKNASALSNAILNPIKTDDSKKMRLNFRAEALGSVKLDKVFQVSPRALGNFNIYGDVPFFGPVSYFRLGLDEIGEGNKLNLQLGSNINEKATVRFGIVRGKLGAGVDLSMKTPVLDLPVTISGEFYDINAPTMRIGVLQNLFQDYGVSLYWDNDFNKGVNEFNLGFRWQPHN